MAKQLFGLTANDVRKLKSDMAKIKAGLARPSRRPVPRRRRVIAGGGSGANRTTLAIVTDPCGASSYGSLGMSFGTVGKAVLLNEDGAAIDANGDALGSLGSATDADKVEFKSLHEVAIPEDAIVELSCEGTIVPGSTWDGAEREGKATPLKKVRAEICSSPHELSYMSTYDENFLLRGAAGDGIPYWSELDTTTTTVVTAFDDEECTVTDDDITYVIPFT